MPNQQATDSNLLPLSINWHFWPYCNYRCRFCFATFHDIPGVLSRQKALKIPQLLAEAGCEKLTFTGGEPTLCQYLGELLKEAKRVNLTTMIVSNGTGITSEFLQANIENIDWVGLSIDSALERTEAVLGRGKGCHVRNVVRAWRKLEKTNIKLKLNTVVTSINCHEDMHVLLEIFQPARWKIFQVLSIRGQNDGFIDNLLVSTNQFQTFVERHQEHNPVAETNEAMQGSYVMLDPLGRFFQNKAGCHVYSQSILNTTVEKALKQVGWDQHKFLKRNGIYSW